MNRLATLCASLAITVGLASGGIAAAAVVYDSGLAPGPYTSGVTADVGNTSSIPSVDFTLGSAASINEVKWAGQYYPGNVAPAADSFTVRFYDLSGATPGPTPLFTYLVGNDVNRVNTGIADYNGQTIYTYDALIPPTSLPAGRYTFSVQDNTPAGTGSYFFWTSAYVPGHQQFLDSYLLNDNFNNSFTLLNSVPEPAGMGLIMVGVAAVLARRNKLGRPAVV